MSEARIINATIEAVAEFCELVGDEADGAARRVCRTFATQIRGNEDNIRFLVSQKLGSVPAYDLEAEGR